MAMTDNLIDIRYRAANGIVDVYSPRTPDRTRRENALGRFDDYLEQTLNWCQLNAKDGSAIDHADYRILDTFLGSISNAVLAQLIAQSTAHGSTLRILLLDPFSPQGSSRSHSLSGGTRTRAEATLQRIHDAASRVTEQPATVFDMRETSLREVVASIRTMAGDNMEIKFHSEITSGISYFFQDVLVKGTTFAGRSAQEGFWDRIVNDPARFDDRYDLYSTEFEEIWEHRAYNDPGDQTGDPNGVFISYRHANAAHAERIYEHLTGRHEINGQVKQLHVDLGEKEAQASAGIEVFLDREDLKLGDRWKEIIRSTLNDKGTMVLLVDPTGMSEWMLLEAGHFWSTNKQVIPILLDPEGKFAAQTAAKNTQGEEWLPPMPSALRDSQFRFWDGRDNAALDNLRRDILAGARAAVPDA